MGHYYSEYYGDAELALRRKDFLKDGGPMLGLDGVRAHQVVKQLESLGMSVSETTHALDVGCGAGGFLQGLLESRKVQVRGLDFNTRCRDFVQAIHKFPVDVGELKETAYPSSSFDIVTSWHCLEHTYDPPCELKEMYRITKPGGWVIVEVPSPSLIARVFKGKWLFLQPPTHLFHFSSSALKSLIEKSGLTVRHTSKPWLPTEFAGSLLLSLGMNRFANRILFENGRISNHLWRILLLTLMPLDLLLTAGQRMLGSSGVIRIYAQKGDEP